YDPVLMSVAWSPDGKQIACALAAPENVAGGIDILDVATGRIHQFVRWNDKHPIEIKWLPNGKGLILQYWRKIEPGRKQIGFVSYPDGYFRTITNDTSSYSGISLSAMATTLATVQQTTMNEITLIPSPGGRTTDIPFRSKRAIHDVAWAIDGGILLSDATRLVHTDIDGSHEKLFLGDPDGRLTGVQSCVEGRSILFEWSFRAGVNRENVWRSDLDGSNAMQ